MSLLAPSLCRTCAKLHIARQSTSLPNAVLTPAFRRPISNTARRALSLATKLPPAPSAKPLPRQIPRKRPKFIKAKQAAAATPDGSTADQSIAALSSSEPGQPKLPGTTQKKPKTKTAAPPQELSLADQLKAALLSDAPAEPEPAKKSRKLKKLKIKGVDRAKDAGGLVRVSKTVADALIGVTFPEKKHHSKPTKTDGIGMLNQRVATTSTRKTPRFQSPTETPPQEYARQEFYLAPTGSFTYDVDVMPFDWRDHRNYVYSEPKRQPWEPVEEVPPPGVIIPRWWPKTQEGWDQLDSPQVHAAEEAYARFNPKQPTDSQEFHRAKKAAVRAIGRHKKEIQQQAEQYEMQVKAAAAGKKTRAPPSPASGGVPNPSQQYLVQADEPSVRLDTAQPLLIVVDLNGTMLHRPNPKREPRKFVQRPYSALFLNYCIKTFWVVVWSSARADNVAVMCDALATPEVVKKDVVAVWARDKFGLSDHDYDNRVQCYKRLTKLWDDPGVAQSHPDYANGGRWSQANTVLIDDTPEKARAEPFNAIIVPEFSNDNGQYDGILPAVHDYINELCFQSNVSSYMRRNPFHARTDFEAGAGSPSSMAFYNAKKAEKERKRARKDYKYDVSSLSLKNTVARAK